MKSDGIRLVHGEPDSVPGLLADRCAATSMNSYGPTIEHATANGVFKDFDVRCASVLDADVNASLRQYGKDDCRFDAIVPDPPKFAPSVNHAKRAARAYKDINRLAQSLLAPGSVLFNYCCSGGSSNSCFHKIVASVGIDAGVDAFISERMGSTPDLLMTVAFPAGECFKGSALLKGAVN